MAFQQYEFNEEKLKQLPFLGRCYSYIYITSKKKFCGGALFEVTQENFHKAHERLKGTMNGEIKAKDRVYVLPQCKIPLFKLKTYLRGLGAFITAEVEKATVIIGHENVFCGYEQHTNSSLLRKFSGPVYTDMEPWHMSHLNTVETATNNLGVVFQNRLGKQKLAFAATVPVAFPIYRHIISRPAYQQLNTAFQSNTGFLFTITPTAGTILHTILLKKIPVINEDQVFKKIGKPLKIDDDSFKTIMEMLSSQDKGNHRIGAEILANCDFEKSYYYLWRVSNSDKLRYAFESQSGFKNVKLFIDQSRFKHLWQKTAEDMVSWLETRNLLDEETFLKLATEAYQFYSQKLQTKIFDVVLTPAEPYKRFPAKFVISTKEDVSMIESEDDDVFQTEAEEEPVETEESDDF